MSDDFLGKRRKALEDSFFAKRNKQLLDQLSQQVAAEKKRDALSAACGVTDEKVLDHLVSLDIGVETLAALCLVPLVQVAWADGTVAAKEREAILSAAADSGLNSGDTAYELLQGWLEEAPSDELLDAWKEYVSAFSKVIDAEVFAGLRDDLLGRAQQVAEAAGGMLGMGHKVSMSEQTVLNDLQQAFAS